MKVVVVRNQKESVERLINRFLKKVQQSRKLYKIKEKRFFAQKPTRRKTRDSALMREYYRSKREKMKHY